jgi:hypothetical protein
MDRQKEQKDTVAQCLELMQALELIRQFGEFVAGQVPATSPKHGVSQ